MADSVRERIVAALATKMASVPGVVKVKRYRRSGVGMNDLPLAVVSWQNDALDDEQRLGFSTARLEFAIDVFVEDDPNIDTDTLMDPFVTGVHKELRADVHLGGLSDNLRVTEVLPFQYGSEDGMDKISGASVIGVVEYVHDVNDLTAGRGG